jgi:hypothetical protein
MITKNKVLLPDSASLIGVIDEDGYLEQGQIFVQIKEQNFFKLPTK